MPFLRFSISKPALNRVLLENPCKCQKSQFFGYGVGSSPAQATCETSQVLLAGVLGVFSLGTSVFAHLLIGLSH